MIVVSRDSRIIPASGRRRQIGRRTFARIAASRQRQRSSRPGHRRSPRPHRAPVDGARYRRRERNKNRAGDFLQPFRSLALDPAIARPRRGCRGASRYGISTQVGAGSPASRNPWTACFAALSSTLTLHHFYKIGSTNTAAMAAAAEGVAEGSVFLAEEQTAGRGRGANSWESARSAGIYCSVVLRPPLPPSEVLVMALAAGLAVRAAIEQVDSRVTPRLEVAQRCAHCRARKSVAFSPR